MLPVEVYDQPVRVEWKLMASLRAEIPNVTNTQLAARLGVNINTITRWLQDQTYQRYENWLLKKNFEDLPTLTQEATIDVQAVLMDRSGEMLERLHNIIQMTGDPKLEADLCQDWLDRAGHAPQRKVAPSSQRPIVMTAEAMEVFMRRAAEAGLSVPPIDVVATIEPKT